MEFRKCTIGGHAYGGYQTGGDLAYPITTGGTTAEEEMAHGLKAVYDNPYRGKLTFADPAFVADIANTGSEQHQIIKEFFTLLAACHTVLADYPDESDDFNIVYKAQSPDEAALVATAKDLGFTFIDRVSDRMTLDILGGVVELKVLNIIEFNSTRKRMSVFVQTAEGQIILYTKGADTVVYERLADGQETMKQLTLDHLESFAEDGRGHWRVSFLPWNRLRYALQVFERCALRTNSFPRTCTSAGRKSTMRLALHWLTARPRWMQLRSASSVVSHLLEPRRLRIGCKMVCPSVSLRYGRCIQAQVHVTSYSLGPLTAR